ncbi:DUF1127 domain-containing protein [Aestuariivirga sp.]|uniref:DUF1127 domain-containing protein n=1 Tax=Aestuariivirga sp. TaxID=2650926 RepID=UPI0039E31030
MFQTILAPQVRSARPASSVLSRLDALWTGWQARRAERQVVKHLRGFDPHLAKDIGLDREALWQLRPELRCAVESE